MSRTIIAGRTPLLLFGLLLLAWGVYRIYWTKQLLEYGVVATGVVATGGTRNIIVTVQDPQKRNINVTVRRPWWKLAVRRGRTVEIVYDSRYAYPGTILVRARFHDTMSLWAGPVFTALLGVLLIGLYRGSAGNSRVRASMELRG